MRTACQSCQEGTKMQCNDCFKWAGTKLKTVIHFYNSEKLLSELVDEIFIQKIYGIKCDNCLMRKKKPCTKYNNCKYIKIIERHENRNKNKISFDKDSELFD